MPIPDYQTIMLPLLKALADQRGRSVQELTADLVVVFHLTEQEQAQLLPSGKQAIFRNRVGWANTYLNKAGLVASPKRGRVKIPEVGRDFLAERPTRIDTHSLERFPAFVAFRKRRNDPESDQVDGTESESTPMEALEAAYAGLHAELQDDLLEQVKAMSPRFFEQIVVDLLVKMGYGGTFRDAALALGESRDGGIDGIIKEDKLGLDTIYLQAKRWSGTVGRPEIHKFAGALQGHRARKGVFMTTSSFTEDAITFARGIDKIVLIDGPEVARLMIENDLGVSRVASFDVKKIDSDYFTE